MLRVHLFPPILKYSFSYLIIIRCYCSRINHQRKRMSLSIFIFFTHCSCEYMLVPVCCKSHCFRYDGLQMGFDPHHELSFQSNGCRTLRDMERGEEKNTRSIVEKRGNGIIDEKQCCKRMIHLTIQNSSILSPWNNNEHFCIRSPKKELTLLVVRNGEAHS